MTVTVDGQAVGQVLEWLTTGLGPLWSYLIATYGIGLLKTRAEVRGLRAASEDALLTLTPGILGVGMAASAPVWVPFWLLWRGISVGK